MSISHVDPLLGRATFDPSTGLTVYSRELPSFRLPIWARILLGGALGGVAITGAYFAAGYAKQRWQKRQLSKLGEQCTSVADRAALLLALASDPISGIGGFLTNAQLIACERDRLDPNRILFFASGGWAGAEHRFGGIPLGFEQIAADSEQRALWWTALTLSKSMTLNGSLAFIIATALIEREKMERKQSINASAPRPIEVTWQGRRVIDIGLCTGALYVHLNSVQPSSSAATKSSSSTPFQPPRYDLTCEIGTLSPTLIHEFTTRAWGAPPNLKDPNEFAEVCEFGTKEVYEYYLTHNGVLPTKSDLPEVVFERTSIQPPQGTDRWVWIKLEAMEGTKEGEEEIYVDLACYFEKGMHHMDGGGWRDEDSGSKLSWIPAPLRSLLNRVSTSIFSPLALPNLSGTPLPHFLSSSRLSPSGYASRITSNIIGARTVVRYIQDAVLINNEASNATHSQMRALLMKALKAQGLPTKYVAHRIEVGNESTTTNSGAASTTSESSSTSSSASWSTSAYRPATASKKRTSRGEKQRQQRRAAAANSKTATVEEFSEEGEEQDEAEELEHVMSPELNEVD